MKFKVITKLTGQQKNTLDRGLTVRIPEDILHDIEKISAECYQTVSNLVRNQLIKFVRWDIFQKKSGIIPVPKMMLTSLIEGKSEHEIKTLSGQMLEILREWTILTKGNWGFSQCIETLKDYLKISEMDSIHKIILDDHVFEIRHNMGENWSLFGKYLFQSILREFGDPKTKYETSPGMLKVTSKLGETFNEHEY